MEILNKIKDKKILDRASIYILNDDIVKYRRMTDDTHNIESILQNANIENPFSLREYSFKKNKVSDYGLNEEDVKQNICDMILKGRDIVWQNNNHIDIYTTKERRHLFDECIKWEKSFNLNYDIQIIEK